MKGLLCERMGHCIAASQSVRHANGSLIWPVALAPPGHTSFQKVNTESHVAACVQSSPLASCDKFTEDKSIPSVFSEFPPMWKGTFFVECVRHENQCDPLGNMVILLNKSCSQFYEEIPFQYLSGQASNMTDSDVKGLIFKQLLLFGLNTSKWHWQHTPMAWHKPQTYTTELFRPKALTPKPNHNKSSFFLLLLLVARPVGRSHNDQMSTLLPV